MTRVEYAKQFIGVPYLWGGNSPIKGVDCSGYICEVLKAEGLIGWNEDLNSQMLYDRAIESGAQISKMPEQGDLLFYGSDGENITHVALALNEEQMIEAGGGNKHTTNIDMAAKQNAMVRVRPIFYRRDFIAAVSI